MASENKSCVKPISNYFLPPKLSALAANAIVRLIVYEDYQDCNYYRCDPVKIWEFEVHQPKKKKGKKNSVTEAPISGINYGHPLPPWKELKKFRDWWCDYSSCFLGTMPSSPMRFHIINAFEKQSWTSQSPEEDTLFLLIRLCIETQMHFSINNLFPLKTEWFADLSRILNQLGPFPLLKLTVGDDIFAGDSSLLTAIIQKSPNLQILRIGQWELQNDILLTLGQYCPELVELEINGMEADVFMNDDAFFKCFFKGSSREQVISCFQTGNIPPISFTKIKYVDILFCRHTEVLIQMLTIFYPDLSMNAANACPDNAVLAEPFRSVGTLMPFLRVSVATKGLLDGRLKPAIKYSSRLKTLMLHVDDQFPGSDLSSVFDQRLEIANNNLREIVSQLNNFDSFVLRPHEDVDMTRVVLSTFSARGRYLKSLSFIYDFSSINTNTIFQLVNLCPELERLVVDVSMNAEDVASTTFVTNLKENPSLETFVLQNNQSGSDRSDTFQEENLACLKILLEVLQNCPNLVNLSFRLEDKLQSYNSLQSNSVERLHVSLSNQFCCHWMSSILPRFSNLKCVSIEGQADNLWVERLQSLSKSSVNITKKKPEFANVIPWEKRSFSSTEPLQIMVM